MLVPEFVPPFAGNEGNDDPFCTYGTIVIFATFFEGIYKEIDQQQDSYSRHQLALICVSVRHHIYFYDL
jgi:hypothetical protein